MPQSLIRAGFTAAGGLGALLGLLAADADVAGPAIQRNWVNDTGGSFHTATNWSADPRLCSRRLPDADSPLDR